MKRFFCLILTLALMLSFLPMGGVMADPTFVREYSFENNTGELGGWSFTPNSGNVSPRVVNGNAYHGDSCIYLYDGGDDINPGIMSPYLEVTPGQEYTVSGYFNIIEGQPIVYIKYWYQVGKQVTDDAGKNVVNTIKPLSKGGWYPAYDTVKVPEGTVYMTVQVVFDKKPTGATYVDLIQIYQGNFTPEIPVIEYKTPNQIPPTNAWIVEPVNGKLQYNTYNDDGDKLSDFSYAGYYAGEYELPVTENLDVARVLEPLGTGEDDTQRIQKAIDDANSLYNQDGKMRVVKLSAGKYYIKSTPFTSENPSAIKPYSIDLKSGVLLSGEGQGPTGTILYADNIVDNPETSYNESHYNVISIKGESVGSDGELSVKVIKDIQSGSNEFYVEPRYVESLKKGDNITLVQKSTVAWSDALGMYGITNDQGRDPTWGIDEINVSTERKVTSIDEVTGKVTVDFPFFTPYYIENIENAAVTVFRTTNRTAKDIGIENLRFESYYNGDKKDNNHAYSAIYIRNAQDVFVRDVTGKHFFFSVVDISEGSKQITVRNCSSLDPVSTVAEGDRRYPFHVANKSQQILFTGCYSYDGRHDYATSKTVTGPIAFVDNVADSSNNASETHYGWSTGVLYDNLYQITNSSQGFIATANRGNYGTDASHGWSSSGSVIWNSLASTIISHDVTFNHTKDGYQNFVIGIWGNYEDAAASAMKTAKISTYKSAYKTATLSGKDADFDTDKYFKTAKNTSVVGDSYQESVTGAVNPRSLYKAQLSERFTKTINNARANAPILVDPKPDTVTDENDENKVKISGIYQLDATKVTVYIDNLAYDATLDPSTNKFTLNTTLTDGVHKIYATQTIDGYEGCKSADRFVIVNEGSSNPEYLQSVYSMDKVTMLNNDERFTYDDYQNYQEVDFDNLTIEYTRPFSGVATAGDPITVKNQEGILSITTPYAALATRLSTYSGYRIKEYGVVFSSSSQNATIGNCDKKVQGAIALTDFYAYGVLFHNLRLQKQYYIRPYAIYEDIKNPENAGIEYVVYGAASGYNITE